MCSLARSLTLAVAALIATSDTMARPSAWQTPGPQTQARPVNRQQVLDAMKRATVFMVETVSTEGGYVWSYLPDLSRRWGELEARATMIWIQPPGTTTMGHLFLDAYHATGDEYYYRAAEKVARALIRGQHPSGGWNYVVDFAGAASLRSWYETVGRNAWRMEEFQKLWGNATFDDGGTADATKFFLRLYVEKRDQAYKAALDHAIQFVLDSQSQGGAWPQRFPATQADGYTSYLTFNDDVSAANVDVLVLCYQTLGDRRLLDPILRGMHAFRLMQQPAPQAGWALQYTPDLQPAGARSYEPKALVTHTTARNVEMLVRFHRLTGDARFLARVPEALEWLEGLRLPPGVAPPGRTHPTFVELGTNRPLYVHRRGSNVVNGCYYVDHDPSKTIAHYSAFRRIDVVALRMLYAGAKALSPEAVKHESALRPDAGTVLPPRFFNTANPGAAVDTIVSSLSEKGYWLVPLRSTSHPYRRDGSPAVTPGDFSQTHAGDETDTSPFPDTDITGISTGAFVRNMSVLIRAVAEPSPQGAR